MHPACCICCSILVEITQPVLDLSRQAVMKVSKLGGITHALHYAMKYSQEVGKNICNVYVSVSVSVHVHVYVYIYM